MSQAFRPRAEEGALVLALQEAEERVGATLVLGPWLNVTALPMVSLETCFARRRRGQWGHGARRGEARRGAAGARGVTAGICLCRSPLTFLPHSALPPCRRCTAHAITSWAFAAQTGILVLYDGESNGAPPTAQPTSRWPRWPHRWPCMAKVNARMLAQQEALEQRVEQPVVASTGRVTRAPAWLAADR